MSGRRPQIRSARSDAWRGAANSPLGKMAMETDAYVDGLSIYVPISGTDEAVAFKVDDLPDSVHDLLGLLQAELAPLGVWLDLAKAYLQRGKEEQFREIMATGCSPGASRSRSDSSASTLGCSRGVKPYDRARPSRAPTRMRREMCLFRSCLPRARSDPDPLPRDPSPSPLQKSRSTTPTPSTSARASFARSRRTTSTSAAPRRTRSSATRTFTAPTSSCPRRSGSRTASPSSSPSSVAPTSRWPAATPPPRRSSSTPRAT